MGIKTMHLMSLDSWYLCSSSSLHENVLLNSLKHFKTMKYPNSIKNLMYTWICKGENFQGTTDRYFHNFQMPLNSYYI